ncbi:MAG: outer membrane lipoprotein-sorting protein [Moraxellaceae bacterium]|nr:MAG: outer membrane lipoprotein-sorting protein [Moraxellaceae bacterium]
MFKTAQIHQLLKPIIAAALLSMPVLVDAETAEEKGLAIFEEADQRGEGYVDTTSGMLMILKDKRGNTSEREMRVKGLEGVDGEGDKTLMIFDTPKDQKGTALLTFSHSNKSDDQWLWLPALKRVKKIASKKKSGPFMGSEFSFEDIGGSEVDEYTYKYLKDETIEGQKCFVVESYPKDKYSGYTRVVTWIDQEHYRTLKVEFYDRKKSHLKTLTATGFKLYNDKFWRPDMLEMINHQTGKSTVLNTKDTVFMAGLKESDFTKNSLKRAR